MRAIFAVAALGAVVLLWLLWPREPIAAVASGGAKSQKGRPSVPSTTETRHDPRAGVPELTVGPPTEELLKKSLDDYRKVAVYPPWSRAHFAGSADKLTWNQPPVDDDPLELEDGKEKIFHFSGDKIHVPYGEAMISWIEVLDKRTRKRLPFTVKSAHIVLVSSAAGGHAANLSFHDDGRDGDDKAGDLRFSNRLVPSKLERLQGSAARAILQAVIEVDGVAQPIQRDFTYAPRKTLDIIGISDAVLGGSLAVTLDLEVAERGLYTFEANVMSGDGQTAIAYSEVSYTLERGHGRADLKFFGRAFREKGLPGPYLVRDIRVFRRFVAGEEENFYTIHPATHTTRPYRLEELSNGEWDDAEKRDTIANFERLIDEAASGTSGTGKPVGAESIPPPTQSSPPVPPKN